MEPTSNSPVASVPVGPVRQHLEIGGLYAVPPVDTGLSPSVGHLAQEEPL